MLTEKDKIVCELLQQGFSIKEIASKTNRSYKTVQHRIDRLRVKCEARNIPQLVFYYTIRLADLWG